MISNVLFALMLAAPAQTGTIQGTVVRDGTSEPVAGVKITVNGGAPMNQRQAQMVLGAQAIGMNISAEDIQTARNVVAQQASGAPAEASTPMTAMTDNDGHFVVNNVPVGRATVRAQLTGYFGVPVNGIFPDSVNTSAVVKENESSTLKIPMVPGGTISGKAFDPNGKPFFNVIVGALRVSYTRGDLTLEPVDGRNADDLGGYRIYPLSPGEYYVTVMPQNPGARATAAPGPEAQVTTLFPNSTTLDGAIKVVVRAGEDVRGIDVHVKTVRTYTVSGHVSSTFPAVPPRTGRGGVVVPSNAVLSLASHEPAGFADILGGVTVSADAEGKFQIPNVAPGTYDLYARMPIDKGWGGQAPPERATAPAAFGHASVEVRGMDVENVQIVVHQGTDVRGRITVDSVPRAAKVLLSLIPDEPIDRVGDGNTSNVFGQVASYRPAIAADGTFSIPVVPEAHYRVSVQIHEPGDTYVADIRQDGVSVYDNGLQVGAKESNPLDVDIRTNGGSVDATVLGPDQKPVAGKTVVLVPLQRRQNPLLYRQGQSDTQGHVMMTNVAPGQYKLFAWDSVQNGIWMNSEYMAKVEDLGTLLTVSAATKQIAQVRMISHP